VAWVPAASGGLAELCVHMHAVNPHTHGTTNRRSPTRPPLTARRMDDMRSNRTADCKINEASNV